MLAMIAAANTKNGEIENRVEVPSHARMCSRTRRLGAWLPLLVLTLSGIGGAASAGESEPLRLCADPDNLPFSSNRAETPGIYVEVGEAIGRAIGRPVDVVWNLTYFGKRAVRTTLLSKKCDASIGLPADSDFMSPRVIFSKPLFEVGYALVTRKPATANSIDDLVGHKVAVQFESTPQNMLALRDDIQKVTCKEPEEAMKLLAEGKVDAAFIWAPIAGYLNKTTLNDAFNIVPVAGPGLQFPAAVAFARDHTALRDEVNNAIGSLAPTIENLRAKYGFPLAATVKHTENEARLVLVADGQGADVAKAAPAQEAATPAAVEAKGAAGAGDVVEGKEIFNGTCAHCHGPDAVQGERRIDLRLMKHRYGEQMDETFRYTVTHGRPAKGMPNWSEVFTNDQFDKILAFLHSVQTD